MSTLPISVQKTAVYTGHKDCIYTLEKSSDSAVFFSASGDGMVVRWNTLEPENGELLAKVSNSVYSLRYVENKNQLLLGQNFEGIHLIDLETKKEIKSVKITASYIFDIQLFGNLIFVACGDGEIIVLDINSFSKVHSLKPSSKSARCIAINPLVNEFVVGFSDNYIRTYSLLDFSLKHEWQAHTNSVFSIQFTPDYKYLVSGSRDAKIKIWDTWNNYDLHQTIVAHTFAINSIAFSPDGSRFATGSMDKTVKIWDTADWKLLKVLDKSRHAGHATSVNKVLWLDNLHLVSGSDDRTVSLWEVE